MSTILAEKPIHFILKSWWYVLDIPLYRLMAHEFSVSQDPVKSSWPRNVLRHEMTCPGTSKCVEFSIAKRKWNFQYWNNPTQKRERMCVNNFTQPQPEMRLGTVWPPTSLSQEERFRNGWKIHLCWKWSSGRLKRRILGFRIEVRRFVVWRSQCWVRVRKGILRRLYLVRTFNTCQIALKLINSKTYNNQSLNVWHHEEPVSS